MRFAQFYIVGRLRNVTFFSLAECNAAIAIAMERMNSREMRRPGMSRHQLFEAIKQPECERCPAASRRELEAGVRRRPSGL